MNAHSCAIASKATVIATWPTEKRRSSRLHAVTSMQATVCQRRSPYRSELHAIATLPIIVNTEISPDNQPIPVTLATPAAFSTVGDQNVTVPIPT